MLKSKIQLPNTGLQKLNPPCCLHHASPSPCASPQGQRGSQRHRGRSQDGRRLSGASVAPPPGGPTGTQSLLLLGPPAGTDAPCWVPKPGSLPRYTSIGTLIQHFTSSSYMRWSKAPNLQSWVAESGRVSSSSHDHPHDPAGRHARRRSPGWGCQGSGPGLGSSLGFGSGGWALPLSPYSTGPHSLYTT